MTQDRSTVQYSRVPMKSARLIKIGLKETYSKVRISKICLMCSLVRIV
jgi:hypothetical protein